MSFCDEEMESIKIVLIGESGVGKTSIICQFMEQVFANDKQSTIGGTFSTKIVKCGEEKEVRLEIWDTAGQERYRSVTKMFYKDANAALLDYDITSKYTYEELKNYWVEQVKETSPKNIILAIIANKADLIENEQVDEEEAREFAQKNNALFALTSAKNNYGINDLFLEIAKKYTGIDSSLIFEEKDEIEEVRNIRKQSVKITKETQKKSGNKKKGCC